MTPTNPLPNGYDAFISHNRAEKPWARELADRLSKVHFNGRPLRPWLDEHYLDPGDLARRAELTTAIDRSRTLLLILSPASVNSPWVKFELEYFLQSRRLDEVIPVLKVPCEIPAVLAGAEPLNFTEATHAECALSALIARMCPPGGPDVAQANTLVSEAWGMALEADSGAFDAEPSSARDALLSALLHFRVDDSSTEGLALTGFWQAAQLLLRNHEDNHPAAYNMKMLLGECLAVAIRENARYRQVAERYLDSENAASDDPVLAFVVARAYSKLAELEPTLIDLGGLLRVATQLDAQSPFTKGKETVAVLLGKIAAKMRGTDLGDLLIQTLGEAGAAARIAAIGGITMDEVETPSVFYVSKLKGLQDVGAAAKSGALQPPSRKLQALLSGIDLDQPPVVSSRLVLAKTELRQAFAIDDLPYGYSWFALRTAPPAIRIHRQPFMGTVARATTANMEELALGLNASHVVCITEPRVVESLFDGAGALLIPVQEEYSPQCQRLGGRRVPFAMVERGLMDKLRDGDHVVIERNRTRIVSHL